MPALPRAIRALRSATLADGSVHDLAIAGDRVTGVYPAGSLDDHGDDVLDLSGHVLITAPAEPHAHIDKALTWDELLPPVGSLIDILTSNLDFGSVASPQRITERARELVLRMLANGTTAIRTHVDVPPGSPERAAQQIDALRAQFTGLVEIEIVALVGAWTSEADIDLVLASGADILGGAPHVAPSPLDELARLVSAAQRNGVGLDLHTDERLDGESTLGAFAAATTGWARGRATASHCVRLATLDEETLAETLDAVRGSGLGIVTLPITNLYLQGWDAQRVVPRALPPIARMTARGIPVAAGADNVRDPFNPVGRADALETASLLVTAGHLDLQTALAAVTTTARHVMGLPEAGPVPGAAAELLAVRATSVGDLIARAPADRLVIHRGRLVSTSHTTVQLPAQPPERTP